MTMEKEPFDIAIIGGGFAGTLTAVMLGRAGHKVVLIDIHAASPALFRAEKVCGDQLDLLRQCDLLDAFRAASTPVERFINIRGKRIVDRPFVEDHGLLYPAMINLLRANLPSNLVFRLGHVTNITTSTDIQCIALSKGEPIEARLAVIATGSGDALHRKLGFRFRQVHPLPTLCVGFSLTPPTSGFRFPALTAYGERQGDNIDYLSIFPLGNVMRANLFVFSGVNDPRIAALRKQGLPALFDFLPGTKPWLAGCSLTDTVAMFVVKLTECENAVRNGVVLIGDAFRVSCPSVGTGLSCALMDVLRLREYVKEWLKTPGMGAEKIMAFYADPAKVMLDTSAQRKALERRDAVTKTSLMHCIRRSAHFTKLTLRSRWKRPGPVLGVGVIRGERVDVDGHGRGTEIHGAE
jgi:2-polyprenyl-6-methoxyphenol hydroxylase-like FAD-dependent oxidoreductase